MAAGMTDPSPAVIVLDVNETLSDMAPMAGRFAEVGLAHADAAIWFAAARATNCTRQSRLLWQIVRTRSR